MFFVTDGSVPCVQWLFLGAWMSVKDLNAGNDHMAIPETVYKCLQCRRLIASKMVVLTSQKALE